MYIFYKNIEKNILNLGRFEVAFDLEDSNSIECLIQTCNMS